MREQVERTDARDLVAPSKSSEFESAEARIQSFPKSGVLDVLALRVLALADGASEPCSSASAMLLRMISTARRSAGDRSRPARS